MMRHERPTQPYAVEYRHNGLTWALVIHAESWEDAERKLQSIGANGRVIGDNVHHVKIPNVVVRLLIRLGIMETK